MSTLSPRAVLLAIAGAGLLVLGCKEQNDNYCGDAPYHNCLNVVDAPPAHCSSDQECAPNACDLAGSMTCVQCTITSAAGCPAATPACTPDNTCVQCTSTNATACPTTMPACGASNTCVQCTSTNATACTATTPVCEADNTCHACTSHAQCSSNVCLADGSCAAEATVAYVAEGGSGTACGKLTPCGTLDAGLKTDRPYVKFAAGLVKDNKTTTIDGKTVTIVADVGAKLDRDGDGAILVVQSSGAATTNVQIFDLEITGATGIPGGDGIRLTANGGSPTLVLAHVAIDGNQGSGVVAAGGALTITRSAIKQNNGGGISEANGTFVVVGNVFFGNGGISSSVGGIAITTASNAVNRLEFNSFNQNTTQATIGPAIHCVVGSFVARNNIMSDNGTLSLPDQFGGSCTHTYSIARPGMMLPGATNLASDPMFVDPTKGDLHLRLGSPARRAADPSSDVTGLAARDLDGNSRTAPADIGAYALTAQASASAAGAVGSQP